MIALRKMPCFYRPPNCHANLTHANVQTGPAGYQKASILKPESWTTGRPRTCHDEHRAINIRDDVTLRGVAARRVVDSPIEAISAGGFIG